ISHRPGGRAAHRGRQAEPLWASRRHGYLGRVPPWSQGLGAGGTALGRHRPRHWALACTQGQERGCQRTSDIGEGKPRAAQAPARSPTSPYVFISERRSPLSVAGYQRMVVEDVIAAVAREPNGGLMSLPDVFLTVHREQIIELTGRYRVPTIYQYRYLVTGGGLIAYGPDVIDQYVRAASYVDRILKGAKPSELPVQAPVKFELDINLKTAKALGLQVPGTLLTRADEVIE